MGSNGIGEGGSECEEQPQKKQKVGDDNNQQDMTVAHEQEHAVSYDDKIYCRRYRRMTKEENVRYGQQVKETQDFDVDNFPRPGWDLDENLNCYSNLAIAQYNTENGKCYEFVKVVKAKILGLRRLIYYITFEARDTIVVDEGGQAIDIFQAKVYFRVAHIEVKSCRLKPK